MKIHYELNSNDIMDIIRIYFNKPTCDMTLSYQVDQEPWDIIITLDCEEEIKS